jgi:recombination protein RecA
VVKNKVAPPFRQAEFDIIYGEGISKEGCVLDLAVEKEIVKKSGTWYSYKEEKVGQGRDNAKEFLKENKKILNEIEQQIRKIYNLPSTFEGEETQQSKSGKNEAS